MDSNSGSEFLLSVFACLWITKSLLIRIFKDYFVTRPISIY